MWKTIKTFGLNPIPRTGHSATLIGSKMFVFGGKIEIGNTNQLLIFDLYEVFYNFFYLLIKIF